MRGRKCVEHTETNINNYYGYNSHIENCTITNVYEKGHWELTMDRYTNNVITRLTFTDSSFYYLPYGLFSNKQVGTLTAINCSLKSITKYDFKGALQLKHLNLRDNNLTELTDEPFSLIRETIISIDLSYNKIEHMEENVFSLTHLTDLNLCNNRITTLESNRFEQSLLNLDLSFNKIEVLPDIFIQNIFQELNLSYNKIKQFDTIAINSDTLDLTSNKLEGEINFDYENFNVMNILLTNNYIEQLRLSKYIKNVEAINNDIKMITTDKPESIEVLRLTNNKLTQLGVIENMTNLIELNLAFNPVAITLSSFSRLTKLEILNLEKTNLKTIEYGTFTHQLNLEFLDLSYNNLGVIDINMFSSNNLISDFFIDGNNLTEIELSKRVFPKLTFVGLSDNYWKCDKLSAIVKQLMYDGIHIQIDEEKYIRNVSNVRGVYCTNRANGELDIGYKMNLSKPIMHRHQEIAEHQESLNDTKNNEIEMSKNLTSLVATVEELQKELKLKEEMFKNLTATVGFSLTSTSTTTVTPPPIETTTTSHPIETFTSKTIKSFDSENAFREMNKKMDSILLAISELKKTNSIQHNDDAQHQLQQERLTLSNGFETESYNDIRVIKVFIVLIFFAGLTAIVLVLTVIYYYKRRSFHHELMIRSNTMTTLNENI